MKRFILGLIWAVGVGSSAQQQIVGDVVDHLGKPVRDAIIQIPSLKKRQGVTQNGHFTIESIPTGEYQMVVQSPYLGASKIITLNIGTTPPEPVHVILDMEVHTELIVTAKAEVQSISDISQSAVVMADEELNFNLQSSLGESIAKIPGISSASFGPGASRPLIRGMGGERLRILESGVDAGDVSSVGPDHAVSIEPFLATRIEILKGASTLRYGGNAVGGVINVIDQRIPEHVPSSGLEGQIVLHANSVSNEQTGAVSLSGGKRSVAWHVEGLFRQADDIEIPEGSLEDPGNVLKNSFVDTTKASVGLSWIQDKHFLGVSLSSMNHDYGLPIHHHEHDHGKDGHEEEELDVTLKMEDVRIDIRGEYQFHSDHFQTLKYQIGSVDYEHIEYEGGQEGTIFSNTFHEIRTELLLSSWGPFQSGSIGIHGKKRDFSALGEEAFVAPNTTQTFSAFVYQEMNRRSWNLDLGLRASQSTVNADFFEPDHEHHKLNTFPLERDFYSFSASLGLVKNMSSSYKIALSLNRTERAPTAEELYSAGPHVATQAFEIGNPDFSTEKGLNAEMSFRKTEGRLTGELNLFFNDFENFIYEEPSEEEKDELPVYFFHQDDARFYGGELHADVDVIHEDPYHLRLGVTLDSVRANLNGQNDDPLPRIPPRRVKLQMLYQYESFWARLEHLWTHQQERVASFETATDGYVQINAALAFQFFWGSTIQQVMLRGTNLSNELGRNHASFVKEQIPLPGRDLSLTWRMRF